MKKIELTQGMFALVDDEDFEKLRNFSWFYTMAKDERTGYASRKFKDENGKRVNFRMHREILGAEKGTVIDHIDGNGLNNQKSNLRICSAIQNSWNRKKSATKKTKADKGVTIVKDRKGTPSYWIARIGVGYQRFYLGTFKTKELASAAYDEAAKKHYGDFALLNKK